LDVKLLKTILNHMMNFSYTLTPSLKQELENIQRTRNKILVELIPPKAELEIQWEETLLRIHDLLKLSGENLKKSQIVDSLTFSQKKKDPRQFQTVLSYKNVYDLIRQNWKLNPQKLQAKDIEALFKTVPAFKADTKGVAHVVEFIQVNPEHPVVQAALALILFSSITPQNQENLPISILFSTVFLYKSGFDFRDNVNIAEFIIEDLSRFQELLSGALRDKNLSSYLEYFSQNIALQAERILKKIEKGPIQSSMPNHFYQISERQKSILSLLNRPGLKITNKTVQQYFKVSQITASRDLVKLATLGLFFSAGKGRSVYYTKI